MKTSILLWVLAILITLGSAVYQKRTGPSYAIEDEIEFASTEIRYSLTRTHGGGGDQAVPVIAPSDEINGIIRYKRYKTDDEWTPLEMLRSGDTLTGYLPHQPPAGKLEYFVELQAGDKRLRLHPDETVVTRFKGAVPLSALIPHVFFMFFAMLISTRTGLEVFRKAPKLRTLTIVTTLLLIVGGLILGPIVQKYAFGEFWTGFPYGTDLTDNKTLIIFIGWLIAFIAMWDKDAISKSPRRRWIVLGSAVLMMLVYLIPHSMMGSEIDYKELDRQKKAEQVNNVERNIETHDIQAE